MTKWYGTIGYAEQVENVPGVWADKITEKKYYGELLSTSRKLQTTDKLNDDINIVNELSIIADPFANQNFYSMKYVEIMGAKWKISDVKVAFPRLILTIGGIYNVEST